MIGDIAVSAVGLTQIVGNAPTGDHTFGNNGAITVHIDAEASKTIYAHTTTPDADITCTARGSHGNNAPTLTDADGGGVESGPWLPGTVDWRAMYTVAVHNEGEYKISCSGPADVRYGVGVDVQESNTRT